MSTTPAAVAANIVGPKLDFTISDPATATVRDVAQAVTAVCNLLCTVEGQKMLARLAAGEDAAVANLKSFGNWVGKLFTGKL